MKNNIHTISLLKKIVMIILLMATFTNIYSQDMIYVNPREIGRQSPPMPRWMPPKPNRLGAIREDHPMARIIMGKVAEITPAFVFYKKESDTSGALYATPVVNIDSVVLSNGTVQRFTKEARMSPRKLAERKEYAKLGTNIISASGGVFTHKIRTFGGPQEDEDYTPFVKTAFSYEKNLLNDRLGIEISPFIAINKKGYGASLHTKFYAKNHGKIRFGMGPFYTIYKRDKTDRYYHPDGYSMLMTREIAMSVLGFGIQLQHHVDRNWLISLNPSIGGVIGYTGENKSYTGYTRYNRSGLGMGEIRLGVGYRF